MEGTSIDSLIMAEPVPTGPLPAEPVSTGPVMMPTGQVMQEPAPTVPVSTEVDTPESTGQCDPVQFFKLPLASQITGMFDFTCYSEMRPTSLELSLYNGCITLYVTYTAYEINFPFHSIRESGIIFGNEQAKAVICNVPENVQSCLYMMYENKRDSPITILACLSLIVHVRNARVLDDFIEQAELFYYDVIRHGEIRRDIIKTTMQPTPTSASVRTVQHASAKVTYYENTEIPPGWWTRRYAVGKLIFEHDIPIGSRTRTNACVQCDDEHKDVFIKFGKKSPMKCTSIHFRKDGVLVLSYSTTAIRELRVFNVHTDIFVAYALSRRIRDTVEADDVDDTHTSIRYSLLRRIFRVDTPQTGSLALIWKIPLDALIKSLNAILQHDLDITEVAKSLHQQKPNWACFDWIVGPSPDASSLARSETSSTRSEVSSDDSCSGRYSLPDDTHNDAT